MLSLLLVVAIIFMLAFVMRRFTGIHGAAGGIKTVASTMVGTRERIAVIQVGDEQHLIGITSQNINHLAKLDNPLPELEKTNHLKDKFSGLLQAQQKSVGKHTTNNSQKLEEE